MIWFIGLIAVTIWFFVYKRQQANAPKVKEEREEKELELLEVQSDQYYSEVLGKLEKELKDAHKSYESKEDSIFTEDEKRENLELYRQELKQFKDMKEKFFRLKERYKHHAFQQQHEIYLDWYNYTRSYNLSKSKHQLFMKMFAPDKETTDRHIEDMRKARIVREEIERRNSIKS